MYLFRERFIKYLSHGIPIHIPDDEVFLFFEKLDEFVNNAGNSFESIYYKGENELVICNGFSEYIRVSYENDHVIFKTTSLTSNPAKMSQEDVRKMGESFMGVVLFLESVSPSEDSKDIPREFHDQWN